MLGKRISGDAWEAIFECGRSGDRLHRRAFWPGRVRPFSQLKVLNEAKFAEMPFINAPKVLIQTPAVDRAQTSRSFQDFPASCVGPRSLRTLKVRSPAADLIFSRVGQEFVISRPGAEENEQGGVPRAVWLSICAAPFRRSPGDAAQLFLDNYRSGDSVSISIRPSARIHPYPGRLQNFVPRCVVKLVR